MTNKRTVQRPHHGDGWEPARGDDRGINRLTDSMTTPAQPGISSKRRVRGAKPRAKKKIVKIAVIM
jgi:hypothetical protein